MSYSRWKASFKLEKDLLDSLLSVSKQLTKLSKKADTKETYTELVDSFVKSEGFLRYVNKVSKRLVYGLNNIDAETWRAAAKKQTKAGLIYKLLMKNIKDGLKNSIDNQVQRNATIIRTLPLSVSQEVVNEVEKRTFEGMRAEAIADLISEKTAQYSRARAGLIARTEVSKTQTALTRSRAEGLDLKWYVWRTEEDGRVRDSHKKMNDVLVKWTQPPSPEELVGEKNVGYYHAGEIYNCRCYPEPLIEIDDVKWPHKVYNNGSITRMTKNQFLEIL